MNNVTVGLQLAQQYGVLADMRRAWIAAEALGVDRLYACDHFHAMSLDKVVAEGQHRAVASAENFEATMIQAAMAATTTRPEIGCLVHGNSFRNPNLMADIARTIDHIAGGRFILGLGSGYVRADYEDYGFDYGTPASRLNDLARNVPIVKQRLRKLIPPPLRRIPLLIGAAGEKVGLRIVAEHADLWHVYGSVPTLQRKIEVLQQHCDAVGRDIKQIEFCTHYLPDRVPDADPDVYLKLGFTHLNAVNVGPKWDLGVLRELLQWRSGLKN